MSVLHPGLSALFAALLLPGLLWAEPVARPKIGLVLSGGGARGLAHVGVLKVLEEARVPVDCIAGTSMGALVGGSYASGTHGDELTRLVQGTRWDDVLSGQLDRRLVSFRQKQLDWLELIDFSLGLRDGHLQLPKSYIGTQKIDLLIRRQTLDASVEHFDQLAIPFRAVAADLESGEMVVFDHGDLALAMRASMAVPGAFDAVDYGGRLLVDGGISRNLPVDLARQTCADVVIAVNVASPPMKRDELGTVFGIADQVSRLLMQDNLSGQLAQLTRRDVLIEPELADIGASDFSQPELTMLRGEQAARAQLAKLRPLALSADDYQQWRRRIDARRPVQQALSQIEVAPLRDVNPEVLKEALDIETGRPVQQTHFHDRLLALYARGDFERIDYRYRPEANGRVLELKPIEKSWGPGYLQFGLGLATDFEGEADFRLVGLHRQTWLNPLGAEWRNYAQLGARRELMTELYQPLTLDGELFLAPHLNYDNRPVNVFIGGARVAEYSVARRAAALDIGSVWGRWGEVRLGVERGKYSADERIGSKTAQDSFTGNHGGYRARLFYDQLDNPHFPHDGSLLQLDWFRSSAALGGEDYQLLKGKWQHAGSLGLNTALLTLEWQRHLGGALPVAEMSNLGGFLRLSGYRYQELMGADSELARLQLYREIGRLSALAGKASYFGLSLEGGRVRQPVDPEQGEQWRSAGSAYIASDTRLGPAYLAVGLNDAGKLAAYFALGSRF